MLCKIRSVYFFIVRMRFVNIYSMLAICQSWLPQGITLDRGNRDDTILLRVYIALNPTCSLYAYNSLILKYRFF